MAAIDPRSSAARRQLTRRDFVTRTGPSGAAALVVGGRARRVSPNLARTWLDK
jgi:hypothetical protein